MAADSTRTLKRSRSAWASSAASVPRSSRDALAVPSADVLSRLILSSVARKASTCSLVASSLLASTSTTPDGLCFPSVPSFSSLFLRFSTTASAMRGAHTIPMQPRAVRALPPTKNVANASASKNSTNKAPKPTAKPPPKATCLDNSSIDFATRSFTESKSSPLTRTTASGLISMPCSPQRNSSVPSSTAFTTLSSPSRSISLGTA
mmetsp:Transcript_41957/g.96298  ORF Transcript_41957/g.96298 Transcript_41957/m.96298 type:complete len:206 (+) Transcript_41957:133-750(+)